MHGCREIGGKLGGGDQFGEGFACGGIKAKKMKSECHSTNSSSS